MISVSNQKAHLIRGFGHHPLVLLQELIHHPGLIHRPSLIHRPGLIHFPGLIHRPGHLIAEAILLLHLIGDLDALCLL